MDPVMRENKWAAVENVWDFTIKLDKGERLYKDHFFSHSEVG
jgi:hypothetical protein